MVSMENIFKYFNTGAASFFFCLMGLPLTDITLSVRKRQSSYFSLQASMCDKLMKSIRSMPLTNIKGREVEPASPECTQKQRQCKNKEYCFLLCTCQDSTVFQATLYWDSDMGGMKPIVAVSNHLDRHASKNILLEISVE